MSAMHRPIARDVAGIRISAIKEMAMRAAGFEGAVSLAWGLPSFRTPVRIRCAAETAIATDPDVGKYSLPDGLPRLRALAAERHRERTGIAVDPDEQVLVTAGNMQGINALLHVLVDPGDEVIVTDPGFASHFQQIRLVGGTPVPWPLDEGRGWCLDADAFERLIGPRTKAVILVSPSNPTGTMFDADALVRVGHAAASAGLTVLIDDPYSAFTYENAHRHFELASRPELGDHLAYLSTFSKSYAMSGWRIGYAVLPAWLKRETLKVHDATLICAPRVSQVAAVAALEHEPTHLRELERVLARRRDLVCRRLDAVPHVFDYVRPDGACYVFPRIRAAHRDSVEFSLRLLDEARVTVTPGSAFGPTGEHHVRMAFCVPDEAIDTAFDRIEATFGRSEDRRDLLSSRA